jgi:hypothetical protein
MMNLKLKLIFLVLIISIFACSSNTESTKVPKYKLRELEQSIFFAEANLGGMSDAGYVQWTPTSAATQLVESMNAAQTLTPEEEKEYKERGMFIPKAIPYVLNQPTAKWQVVVIGDETGKKIILQGYGSDLTQPLVVKEIPCCQF